MSLHNFGVITLDTATATFSSGSGLPITATEVNSSSLTVAVVSNIITVTARSGGNNRGTFTVRVTPTSCGAYKDITVNVAK
jgi:hypothetical protein